MIGSGLYRGCLAACCLLGCALPVPAATWFVATNGNDTTGTGAIAAPFRTLNSALQRAVSGDVVEVRSGTYREAGEVRFRRPGVTMRSYAGEWAVLSAPRDDEDGFSSCVLIDPDADGTRLSRLEITGGYYYGVMLQTKWDWGDPADRMGACRITIEDCVIHDTGRDGIKITPNCDDVLVRRCEIYNTGVGPANVSAQNAEGIDCVNGDRVVVEDCAIHDVFSTGIYLKGGSTDSRVERTRVSRCGGGGILLGFDTSPEYFDLAANPRYYENIRGTVRNCLVRETGWEGIGMYAASNPAVYNNTLVNVCTANVHAALYFGLTYQDWDPSAGRPPSVNPVIHNNLVAQPAGFSDESFEIRYSGDLGGMSALTGWPAMDYNGYFIAGGGVARFTDRRPGSPLEQGTLAQWRAHAGTDAHSLTNNPLFTGGVDYTLQADSPYVDQGTNAAWMAAATDLDGRPRIQGGIVDVGACERPGGDTRLRLPPAGHLYHGVYPGGRTGDEDDLTVNDLRSYEQTVRKTAAWTYFSHNWFHGRTFPSNMVQWIRATGSLPFIRLMLRSDADGGHADPVFTLARIIAGDFDADLRAWMRGARDSGTPLLAEYGTEANGEWFPWNGRWNGGGTTNGYGDPTRADGPERFRDACRHIIQLGRAEGASNITWVFHANWDDWPDVAWNRFENYYPGDEWIDWIGVSAYGAQTPMDDYWDLFRDMLDAAYPRLTAMAPGKPLVILEFGAPARNPLGDQAAWAEAALADLTAFRWPAVIGFSWWNEWWQNDDNPAHDTTMRVQDNPALAAVFQRRVGANDHVLGRPILSGIVAPVLHIETPTNGAAFNAPANISITVGANDPDGTIVQVAVYAGATLLGTDFSPPFQIAWGGVAAGVYELTARATDNNGLTATSMPVNVTVQTDGSVLTRINCGGGALSGGWAADTGFSGGAAGSTVSSVANATLAPMALYQSDRNAPSFRYSLSAVPNGTYQVRLHFCEMLARASGQRVFHVAAEGVRILNNLDIYASAGGRLRALARTFTVTISDGNGLQLDFTRVLGYAQVCGIEVESLGPPPPAVVVSKATVTVPEGNAATFGVHLNAAPAGSTTVTVARASGDADISVSGGASLVFTPGNYGTDQPVTLAAGEDGDTAHGTATIQCAAPGYAVVAVNATEQDNDVPPYPGKINCGGGVLTGGWATDTGFSGGGAGATASSVANATLAPMALYQADRNGTSFRYSLAAVPNGTYQVRLHFCEMLARASGQRVFHVAAEGVRVLSDLDVFAAAGGRLRALARTINVNVSDGNGMQLDFNRVLGYAQVCGIEITPVGGRRSTARAIVDRVSAESLLPDVVLTSEDKNTPDAGWAVVDGDPETIWQASGSFGSWICLGYEQPVDVSQVEVEFTEDSPQGLLTLASKDARDWLELGPELELGPVQLNYLWLIFPVAPSDLPPAVMDIKIKGLSIP